MPFNFKNTLNELLSPPKLGQYDAITLYKRLYTYIHAYWFRALVATFITIPIGALDSGIALALQPYVDVLQANKPLANLSLIPIAVIGFTLIQGILNYISIYLNGWLGFRIMNDMRRDLFKKLQSMDTGYFDSTTTGFVLQQYYRDPESIQTNVLNNTRQMLTRVFSSISLTGVLIYASWKLSIIAVGILLLILYPSTLIRKRLKDLFHETTHVASDIMTYYSETVSGIKTIYGFNLPDFRLNRFNETQKMFMEKGLKSVKMQGWLTPSMHLIASIGIALILWQGSLMVFHHEMTAGSFASFVAAMLMLYNPIKNLGSSIVNAQISLFAAGRVFRLLDLPSSIKEKEDALTLDAIHQGIAFRGVGFRYLSNTPMILKNFTLEFKKGEVTALVGGSGGGKSTIVNLIPRFYDILEGAICVDDRDIRDIQLKSLREKIAVVTQENFLFCGTIRENLQVGKHDATEAEMWQALEKAYLSDFVQQLVGQLDTEIGERGVMMSGGQRQRLAIARAFLKDAPIVIFDEATSALDNQSEAMVQKAMNLLMQHRTVIVIAHRLTTVQHADKIVVIDEGQVVESGTHQELIEKNGAYSRLYLSGLEKRVLGEAMGEIPEHSPQGMISA